MTAGLFKPEKSYLRHGFWLGPRTSTQQDIISFKSAIKLYVVPHKGNRSLESHPEQCKQTNIRGASGTVYSSVCAAFCPCLFRESETDLSIK